MFKVRSIHRHPTSLSPFPTLTSPCPLQLPDSYTSLTLPPPAPATTPILIPVAHLPPLFGNSQSHTLYISFWTLCALWLGAEMAASSAVPLEAGRFVRRLIREESQAALTSIEI